ncbi:MAG: choice-of-anchor A family protein, partial [Oscillospiraceae bacterium]|nr:choice-of-anchor A family protein [Oscillospiraceae bacterium]
MKKSFKKRLLSGVTSALLAVSSTLPNVPMLASSSPVNARAADDSSGNILHPVYNVAKADGNKKSDGTGYWSPKALSESDLLVGAGSELAAKDGSAATAIQNASDKYFLGIASQFSIFLREGLTVTASDAEGRVAVGGDLKFVSIDENGKEQNPWYNYVLGNGDYQTMTALKNTDEYKGVTDFAHAIVGGSIRFLNPLSSSDSDGGRKDKLVWSWGTVYYPEDEDLYKRFVVQSPDSFKNSEHMTWSPFPNVVNYRNGDSHDSFKPDEESQFYDASANPLIDFEKIFTQLKEKSEALATVEKTGEARWENNTELVLEYKGDKTTKGDTIYFVVDKWVDNMTAVKIQGDISGDENYIITCGDKEIKIDSDKNLVKTTIDGISISKDDGAAKNNNPKSSQILYNFPNATDVKIDCNFNGTILAPIADVTSDIDCHGHLSGALIANSFKGGLEFGYRPYLGLADILSVDSEYWIDLYKYATENGEEIPLKGATFGLFKYDEKTGTIAAEPSASAPIDPTDDLGRLKLNVESGTYAIKEITAPDSYAVNPDVICYLKLAKTEKQPTDIPTGDYTELHPVIKTSEEYEDLKLEERANYIGVDDTKYIY